VYLYPGDKLRSKPTSYSPRGVSLGWPLLNTLLSSVSPESGIVHVA
jgi:hypothetical protein